ncbi:MAG: hypothetical protein IH840_17960 [Candidatus Heimdallarchaeota archaeon]|nr:hypothetical protein [Candidatus Heimdallarchaeota archaeon]
MSNNSHKRVVQGYVEAINNEDWEMLETLIHDDFHDEVPISPSRAQFKINPTLEFMKLLHFDEDLIDELQRHNTGTMDKTIHIESRKIVSRWLTDWQITDMIAEDDKVWVSRVATIRDPLKLNTALSSTMKFMFKDKKIIGVEISGRYLNSLIQYGRVVVERSKKDEIAHYMLALRNLGIIPPDILN